MSSHDDAGDDLHDLVLPSDVVPAPRNTIRYALELEKAKRRGEDGVVRFSFGAYMRAKRDELGLSMRQAAKQSGISEGRWRQLESGYQSVRGEKIPAKTTPETVLRVAAGMGMHPDVALLAAGIRGSRVKVSETGIWPLPKHVTVKRAPGGPASVTKESHVTSDTLRRAKARLRTLEKLCESIEKLPRGDLEYLHNFIEGVLDEHAAEEQRLHEELAHGLARMDEEGLSRREEFEDELNWLREGGTDAQSDQEDHVEGR